jgi:predicted amidophosphoribosyltransferase
MTIEDEHIRGYNQAELLAGFLAEHFNFEVKKYLLKNKKTKRQSMLKNKSKRWQNVENVYRVIPNKINQNQDVVVVDDVITSGATISTIAKQLKTQTKGKIIAWSLFKSY